MWLGASGKNIVFGIYQKNGKVLTFSISSCAKETMQPCIAKYTKVSSLYYTDDWFSHAFSPVGENHPILLKDKGSSKAEITPMGLKDSASSLSIGYISIEAFLSFIPHST